MIDNAVHEFNPKLTTWSEDKIEVWGHLMIQYNLKPDCKSLYKGEQMQL
jgi:hypothetical protein